MARKVVFFLSMFGVFAATAYGCAPDLRITEKEEPWGAGGDGGASSSSSGQAGGSTSSSTGGPITENCLDGIDNDGDGNTDCADSDCTVEYECVDAIPNGWTIALIEQGSGMNPPKSACADGSSPDLLFTNPANPAECSPCECGPLTGTTCDPPTIACNNMSSLCPFNSEDWTSFVSNGNCVKPIGLLGGSATLACELKGSATVQSPGSCAASAVDFPNKDTWGGWVLSCSVHSGGGCGSGAVCIPKAAANEFQCIRNTSGTCPVTWSQKVFAAYEGGDDNRSCTACSCNASPTCSGGSYTFYDGDACSVVGMDPSIIVDDAMCHNVSALLDGGSWSVKATLPVVSGSCTPTGGESIGSVTPTGVNGFCCK